MVPNGWLVKSLNDITNWSSGGTPSKSNPAFWNGDVPWISAASMRGHYFGDSEVKITEKAVSNGAKMAPQNSLLLLVRGSMLWNKIPVGIATRKVSFNQDVKCLKPDISKTDSEFLLYWFLNNEHRLMSMVTGTGIGAGKLDTTDLQNLDVFLPPLPEQQKIAKILSTWDKAITTTERLIATSQQQKKALMQQLLTGKKRLVNPDTGMVFEGDWEEVKLKKLGKCLTGLTYSPDDVREEGILVLRSSNIQNGKLCFDDNVFVNKEVKDEVKTKYGDILVCVRNGSRNLIGKSAFITDRAIGLTHGAFMTLFRGKYPELIYQLFQTPQFYKQVSMNLGATINSINTSDLHKFKFKVPYDDLEVKKIASVLTAADKEIELLEVKLAHLKEEKKALMQQLLTGKRQVKVEHTEEVTC
ncbi:restriction endonuclease subunit S [Vibrio sp. LQ2]|uniref:restriction endonuclease subunit S n=1 Tax=Vibrio sp. LQ2 TaxID=2883075 RepID=UPI00208ED507|nr:restriction endonuclease subunit S [Vibrio sp. LQ2]USP05299.1 restriction endonuclease subunit S [Vibrio sp. LQ2]